jgi:uridylate kinase
MYKSIVLKISGEELGLPCSDVGKDEVYKSGFDDAVIEGVIKGIIGAVDMGVKVAAVIGGGNFWRGRDTRDGFDRTKSDSIGMLATVMNALYAEDFLRVKSGGRVTGVIMTPFPVGAMTEVFNRDKALGYQERGKVVFLAGGMGYPFFSTDMIAAIRAAELNADALLFAKPVDGFYDGDPLNNPKAKKLAKLTYERIIDDRYNMKAIDLGAACFCAENGIKAVLFKLSATNSILTAVSGDESGILEIGSIVE